MNLKIYKWVMIYGGIFTALLWIGMVVLFFRTNPFPTSPWLPVCVSGVIALPIIIALVANGIKSQEIPLIHVLSSELITPQNESEVMSSEEGNNNKKQDSDGQPVKYNLSQSLKDQLSQLQAKYKDVQRNNEDINKQIIVIQEQKEELEKKYNNLQESTNILLDRLEPKWSKAMYELYSEQWNVFFDNVDQEIDGTKRIEFLMLLWNVASQTMDFLMFANSDPNYLRINENITNAIVEGKKISEVEHKEFFDDPNTVEKRALAVYNFFKSQLDEGQDIRISAFGYDIHIENSITETK